MFQVKPVFKHTQEEDGQKDCSIAAQKQIDALKEQNPEVEKNVRVHPWQRLKVCAGSYPSWSNTSQKLGGGEKPPKKTLPEPVLDVGARRAKAESLQTETARVESVFASSCGRAVAGTRAHSSATRPAKNITATKQRTSNRRPPGSGKRSTTVQDTPAVDGDRRTEVD